MKVTTGDNVKQFMLYKINSIILGFENDKEVELTHISDWDFDLERIEETGIEFTNVYHDVLLESYFSGKQKYFIKHIHVEGIGMTPDGEEHKVMYDIPCQMQIRNLRMSGSSDSYNGMFVRLEGFVK